MADGITDEVRRAGWDTYVAAIEGGYDSPQVYAQTLEAIITAFAAGRAVVDLPEPAGEDADGPYWMGSRAAIQADVERGVPIVRTEWEDFEADAAEADALARLAAVREARRLAAGQSSEAAGGVL